MLSETTALHIRNHMTTVQIFQKIRPIQTAPMLRIILCSKKSITLHSLVLGDRRQHLQLQKTYTWKRFIPKYLAAVFNSK